MSGTTVRKRLVWLFWTGMTFGDNERFSTGWKAWPAPFHLLPDLFDACGQLLHEVVHRAILPDHACDL